MKKNILILLLFLSLAKVNAQKNEPILKKNSTKVSDDSLKIYVENLRIEILNDTLKFNKKDLIAIDGQTENSKQYSKMYLVDMKLYVFKLKWTFAKRVFS